MEDRFELDIFVNGKRAKSVEFRATSLNNVMKRIIKEMRSFRGSRAVVSILEWDDDYKAFSQADYGTMTTKVTPMGTVYYWDNKDTIFYGSVEMGIVDPTTGYVIETKTKKKSIKAAPTVTIVSRPAIRPVPVQMPKKTATVKPIVYAVSIPKAKEPSKPKEKPITVDGLRLKGTSFYQVITKRKVGGRDTTSIVYSDFDPRNAFRELIAHQRKSKKPYTLLAGYVTAGGSPEYGNPDRSGKYTVIPGKDIGMTGTYLKEIVRNETRYYKILRNGMFLPIRK